MGLDIFIKFKTAFKYKDDHSDEFSPFGRGYSSFIMNHLRSSNSLLLALESFTKIELAYLTKPNLYDYMVDPMQLDFASGEELDRLQERQKDLDKKAHQGWMNIQGFRDKLKQTINALKEIESFEEMKYSKSHWQEFLADKKIIADLESIHDLLAVASYADQKEFSYILKY